LPLLPRCGIVASISNKSTREEVMRKWQFASVLLALAASAGLAAAQDYPTKPIRVFAAQGPGGLSDVFMRALAEELRPLLGETVVVENRVGASGSLAARLCADATPDGYTICILNGESMVINPLILRSVTVDPRKDLVHITRLFYITAVFAVNTSLNVKTFDQLATLARSKPKTMNYMAPQLAKVAFMERFNKLNGTDFVRVPFKGGGDAVNSMLSGTTPVVIFGIGNVMQYLRDGRIVGLAVDGDKRSPLMPNIPTFKELGYAVHVMQASFGIHAPAGTPRPIVDKLHAAIVKAASKPEFQQRHMIPRGLTPVLDTPEQFAKQLEQDRLAGVEIVRGSGLYPDLKIN
jgi:tripartite-type tricarboxylate transporter receptor subunit TctC